tara:strand:- start:77 stop:508 length:432 start_codon:yes stop_codon:yes gene_type:complete
MADNYYTKKFKNTTELAAFLNFSEATILEYGTGYVSSNNLIAVTQTNYSDWRDIDDLGADLAGVVIISGASASDQFRTLGAAGDTGTIAISPSHSDIGTLENPVNYRVYSAATTFPSSGEIKNIYSIDNGIVLLWTDAAPIHF